MAEAEARLSPAGPVPRRHAHSMSEEQWPYNDRCGLRRGNALFRVVSASSLHRG